jgi:hypothetical protein
MSLAFGLLFFFTGLAALLGGGFMLLRRGAVLIKGATANGIIESWERNRDLEIPDAYTYFPHVRFEDMQGRPHVARIDRGYNTEKFPLGSLYKVRFDPQDPKRAYAAHPGNMLGGAIALILLGAAALWVGISMLLE